MAAFAVAALACDDKVDEAAATVAAALIGVAGTFAGHKAGHRHGTARSEPPEGTRANWIAVGVIAFTTIIGVAVHLLMGNVRVISADASAALLAALAGVAATAIAHERWLLSGEAGGFGRAAFVVLTGVCISGVCISVVFLPGLGISPSGAAAFAAAAIGVAATFLAHRAGRAAAESRR